jgi:hypothetical protein
MKMSEAVVIVGAMAFIAFLCWLVNSVWPVMLLLWLLFLL